MGKCKIVIKMTTREPDGVRREKGTVIDKPSAALVNAAKKMGENKVLTVVDENEGSQVARDNADEKKKGKEESGKEERK